MKVKITIISILIILFAGTFFLLKTKNGGNNMAQAADGKKVLVAYFSRTGEQYGVGNITEGNTAIIGKMIAKQTGADTYEIKVVNDSYPTGYNPLVEFAKKEKQAKARPKIIGKVENFDDYGTIFVGYPNWWGDMPMPVYTFLESYDFSNKKVYHFCTHEGSGGVDRNGFAIYGHTAQNNREEAEQKVNEWLKGLGY